MPTPTTSFAHDRPAAVFLNVVLLAAVAIAWPFAEGGYVDDFAYAHMVKSLAETGHFAYNGWPTAMLGLQVWWAAAWVWLFGFSFTIVRISTLPLACGAVSIAYLLARRATLSPTDSLFIALSLALTPLFFKLAPTFMSDVPALCFLLASLYAFVLAIESPDRCSSRPFRTWAWVVAGTAIGIAGGTIRQNVWLAAPVGAACLVCTRGTGRSTRIMAAACGSIGLVCLVAGTAWFNDQPYVIPSRLSVHLAPMPLLKAAIGVVQKCGIHLLQPLIFCLPPLLAARAWSARNTSLIWCGSVLVGAAMLFARQPAVGGDLAIGFGSWGGLGQPQSFVRSMIGDGMLLLRVTPVVAMLVVIAVGLLRSGFAAVGAAVRLPPAITVPLVYLVPYTAAVIVADQTTGGLRDRYVLPHIPILACWLLLLTRRSLAASGSVGEASQAASRSRWGWGVLAVGAVVALADSHDCFAVTRARVAAVDHLRQQGVPRDRIMAGIAIDGWEQIERMGYINDARIRRPADAYRPLAPDGYPDVPNREKLPTLVPEYIITDDRTFFPGDSSPFVTFPFATWLPPFGGEVRIHHQPAPDNGTHSFLRRMESDGTVGKRSK